MQRMRPCHVVEIVTPKRYLLNGLWFGPKKPKRVIIWIHGLGSSAFTKLYIVDKLVDKNTVVITFNNRGHDKVSSTSSSGRGKHLRGGAAHEVFTDCVDDIEGAIRFAKRAGARSIVLAGHSTGGQKSAYECFLTPAERRDLLGRLRAAVDPAEDRVLLIRLDTRSRVRTLGIAREPLDKPFFYCG